MGCAAKKSKNGLIWYSTLVLCYNLDRLGRGLSHLVQLLGEFAAHKVALIVPGQGINTSSSNPASALLLNMLGAIAQFETPMIVERVNAGLAAARGGASNGPSSYSRCSSRGRGQTARTRTHRTRHRQREGIRKFFVWVIT